MENGNRADLGDLARHVCNAGNATNLVCGAGPGNDLPNDINDRSGQDPGLMRRLDNCRKWIMLDAFIAGAGDANAAKGLWITEAIGPFDGPGKHDVLFNNRLGVVVPPGIVDLILKKITTLFRYGRSGGLYYADVICTYCFQR